MELIAGAKSALFAVNDRRRRQKHNGGKITGYHGVFSKLSSLTFGTSQLLDPVWLCARFCVRHRSVVTRCFWTVKSFSWFY